MNNLDLEAFVSDLTNSITQQWMKFDEDQNHFEKQKKIYIPILPQGATEEEINEHNLYYEQLSIDKNEEKSNKRFRVEIQRNPNGKQSDKMKSKGDSKDKAGFQTLKSLFKKLQKTN